MRNSKGGKLAFKILLFTAITVTVIVMLGDYLYPSDSSTGMMMKAYFREKEGAPDALLLGTSLSYYSFVPLYYSELTGEDINNLSTSAQSYMLSYYILRESVDRGKIPRTVFLLASPNGFMNPMINDYTPKLVHSMPWSLNKLSLLTRIPVNDIPNNTFRAFNARSRLTSSVILSFQSAQMDPPKLIAPLASILARIKQKLHGVPETTEQPAAARDETIPEAAADPEMINPGEKYTIPEAYRKYINIEYRAYNAQHTDPIDNHSVLLTTQSRFDRKKVTPEAEYWFEKIVSCCREKGIELIVYSVPCLPAYMIYTGYEEFHDYVSELTGKYGLAFWNLAYIRPEWVTTEPSMYIDFKHGNYRLAFPLTKALAEIRKEHLDGILDLSRYLFDSFDGYLEAHQGINGVQLTTEKKDGQRRIRVNVIKTPGSASEWRALALRDGEWVTYQDWNDSDTLLLEKNHVKTLIRFEIRDPGTGVIEQTVEKTY